MALTAFVVSSTATTCHALMPSVAFRRYDDEGSTNFAMLPGMWREPVEQSRFFYCAKATAKERDGSKHPTIKPLALMRWLVRLVTPPNGMVLDPFAGTGTTGEAAYLEGFRVVMCEQDLQSCADIERRVLTGSLPPRTPSS